MNGNASLVVRWQKNHDILVVRIYRDLAGDWVLARCEGHQLTPEYYQHTLLPSYQAALQLLRQISREQRQRGFRRTAASEEQLGFDFS